MLPCMKQRPCALYIMRGARCECQVSEKCMEPSSQLGVQQKTCYGDVASLGVVLLTKEQMKLPK